MRLLTNNSLQQMKTRAGAQVRPDIPMKMYLDLTQDCNMYCIMCRDHPGTTGRVMEMALFRRLVDETCAGVTSYSLFNWGESLLLKDFRERLLYLATRKRENALIDLATNGMLLSEGMSRFLLEYNVEVTVSFDGANEKTFEQIRRGGNFKQVCTNLERLAALASGMNPYRAPGIYISVQKSNWTELPAIVAKAHTLGVKRVGMGLVVGPVQFRQEPSHGLLQTIAQAINDAEQLGMVVDLYPTKIGDFVWDGDRYVEASGFYVEQNCDAPLTCVSVAWNGDVFLCCNVGEFVDNIRDKSFADVWLGMNYAKLRERVNNRQTMPEMCKNCPWVNRY